MPIQSPANGTPTGHRTPGSFHTHPRCTMHSITLVESKHSNRLVFHPCEQHGVQSFLQPGASPTYSLGKIKPKALDAHEGHDFMQQFPHHGRDGLRIISFCKRQVKCHRAFTTPGYWRNSPKKLEHTPNLYLPSFQTTARLYYENCRPIRHLCHSSCFAFPFRTRRDDLLMQS